MYAEENCIFEEMDFIAKVEDTQRPNIQEIAKSLEKMGIQVKQILKIPGVITGSKPACTPGPTEDQGYPSVERGSSNQENAIRSSLYLSASSIHTGAWSLFFSHPRTWRSTPAATRRFFRGAFSRK